MSSPISSTAAAGGLGAYTAAEYASAAFAGSFLLWLGECGYVLDPPPGLGRTRCQLWPHLSTIVQALVAHRLVVVLKARQVGVSWLLAAYALWTAAYRPGAVVLMLSRGQDEAATLLAKARYVWSQLPDADRPALGANNAGRLEFPRMSSRIAALPATQAAGRSEAATLVIQDEADWHEYLAENYAAIKPTIDAGGQLIQVSTVNKATMGSLFKGLFRGAPGNGYEAVFVPWYARPGRDQAWYDRMRANVPREAGMTPDLYMEQEYPGSAAEALAPSQALAFFQREALSALLADCAAPVEQQQGGLISLWRPPVVAGRYVIGADIAWGEKSAYSCAVVMDYNTGAQVAELYGRPPLDEAASALVALARRYNNAYLGIECNGEGAKVVAKCDELGYGHRMYARIQTPKHSELGWLTDGRTRPVMLADLEEAVRLRQVVPRCQAGLEEFYSFIRQDGGRPSHAQGSYDDHVMAWAIAWQMRQVAQFATGGARPTPLRASW